MLSSAPSIPLSPRSSGPMSVAVMRAEARHQTRAAFDGLDRSTDNLAHRRERQDRDQTFEARIACDPHTWTDAFRLRHLCYASKGFIDARPNCQFSDNYDAVGENTTVVIYERGQPVGSVRVCTMSPTGRSQTPRPLPVAHVFPDEMAALLGGDGRAVEINRLVCHPAHDHNQGLVFTLMRMADYVIRRHDPDFATSCVRTNHAPFYRRLTFRQVAGPRLYTGLKFMTTLMVARRETSEAIRHRVPMLQITPGTAARYDRLWDGDQVGV